MTVKHVDEQHCDRRHGRIWWTFWCGFSFALIAIGGLAAYGFSMHQKSAVNESRIENIRQTQRDIKKDVEETRKMVYDIWRANGGKE